MGFRDLKEARRARNRFAGIPEVKPLETRNLAAPEVAPAVDPDPEPEELAGQAGSPPQPPAAPSPPANAAPAAPPPAAALPAGRPAAPPEPRDSVQGGRVDGRSLRATGRTEQLNIKVRPDIKAKFLRHARREGKIAAVLLEQWIEGLPE